MHDPKKIQDLVDHNMKHEFFSKFYEGRPVIDSYDAFLKLPTMRKRSLLEHFGSASLRFTDDTVYARSTSGTSESMAIVYYTELDDKKNLERFQSQMSYMHDTDRVLVLWPPGIDHIFTMHLRSSGATVAIGNCFDLAYSAKLAREMEADTLCITPALCIKIGELLRDYQGIHKIILGGSGVSGMVREKLQELFPGASIIMTYGLAETGKSLYQCPKLYGTNLYHTFDDDFLYEILKYDEDSPCSSGEEGELTFTKLWYPSGLPLIRYRTGDTAIISGRCGCGKDTLMITGRTGDDSFKLKGLTFYNEDFENILSQFKERIYGDFRVHIHEVARDDLPVPFLEVEISCKDRRPDLRESIQDKLNSSLMISADYSWKEGVDLGIFCPIEVRLVDEIPGAKTKKIIDHRISENSR